MKKFFSFFLLMTMVISSGFADFAFAETVVKPKLFTKKLYRGLNDSEVKTLQDCLQRKKELYPEGVISGYFGVATEKAVQRFQTAQKIISSGTPATTGFGVLGPKTREILSLYCMGKVNSGRLYLKLTPKKTVSSLPKKTVPKNANVNIQTEIEKILQAEGISKENMAMLRNSPITKDEGELALKEAILEFGDVKLDVAGPNNCRTFNQCRAYCEKPKNFATCVSFIKKFLKNSL